MIYHEDTIQKCDSKNLNMNLNLKERLCWFSRLSDEVEVAVFIGLMKTKRMTSATVVLTQG